MRVPNPHIIVLYNEDLQAIHGSPADRLAVQSTIATSGCIHQALLEMGHSTERLAVHDSLEEMSRSLEAYPRESTFIFNNCDGFNGSNQDAVLVVNKLDELGYRHTGGNAQAVGLCIDKPRAKRRLGRQGVPTPHCQVFTQPSEKVRLRYPLIVKPAAEDGSMGITLESVVTNPADLRRQVESVLETYQEPVLVEEFIPGRELAVALLGNPPRMEPLPIAEQDYHLLENPLEHLLTYESKWEEDSFYFHNILSSIPAELTRAEEQQLQETAVKAFRALGLHDFARVDIRFHSGIPYVIDVNELPDLAPDGGYWRSAQAAGMTYAQMIDKIITHALAREGWKQQ